MCLHARGVAHFLLEQYPEAEAALLSGLSLEPRSAALCAALADVSRVLAEQDDDARAAGAAGGERRAPRASAGSASAGGDEAECTLCMRLLYAPVTTPCGHSFCRGCLGRALDHKNRCPLCRTVLCLAPAALQVSLTLAALLKAAYPEDYAKRAAEEEPAADGAQAQADAARAAALLPLFVMDVVLPGQHMSLNVFEPRYRLMTRRAMAGSRRFGMCGVDAQHCLLPWATEVEVTECEALPDGRFYLEVVGRRRCRIVSSEEQDGYRLARVEFGDGEPAAAAGGPASRRSSVDGGAGGASADAGAPAEAPPARVSVSPLPGMEPAADAAPAAADDGPEAVAQLAARADVLASSWIERLRSCGGVRHAEYLARAGARPPARDAPALAWWIANLLPVPSGERYALLAAPTDAHRLRRELELMSADGGACAVM